MKPSNVRKVCHRYCDSRGLPVPCLALQGRHMEQYGFFLGEMVSVVYERGKITVVLIDKSLIQPIGGDKYGYQERLPILSNIILR